LWFIASLAGGVLVIISAKTAMQELEAVMLFLNATVAFGSILIADAIERNSGRLERAMRTREMASDTTARTQEPGRVASQASSEDVSSHSKEKRAGRGYEYVFYILVWICTVLAVLAAMLPQTRAAFLAKLMERLQGT
jgi:hypothetical protein